MLACRVCVVPHASGLTRYWHRKLAMTHSTVVRSTKAEPSNLEVKPLADIRRSRAAAAAVAVAAAAARKELHVASNAHLAYACFANLIRALQRQEIWSSCDSHELATHPTALTIGCQFVRLRSTRAHCLLLTADRRLLTADRRKATVTP